MLTAGRLRRHILIAAEPRSVAIAPAIRQLLNVKYNSASPKIGITTWPSAFRSIWPGIVPDARKKPSAAARIAIAGAAALKSNRLGVLLAVFIQNEITSASKTTVTVPAAVPNSNTEVKTNVSETERLAGRDGSWIVKQPAKTVNDTRTNHWNPGGFAANSHSDRPMTVRPVATTTLT